MTEIVTCICAQFYFSIFLHPSSIWVLTNYHLWGSTGSHVTGIYVTGSDVSHMTGSDVSHVPSPEGKAAGWWFSPGTPVSSINKTDIFFYVFTLLMFRKTNKTTINKNKNDKFHG